LAKLRLGLIGAGIAARDLHGPALKELSDRFEVAAIATRTPERARAIADLYEVDVPVYADHRQLLERGGVDAVVVAVPIDLNLPITRDCLNAGMPVALEKPLGANLAEAAEVVALAEEGRATLFILENFRYWPDLQLARRLVEEGVIGKLGLVSWHAISFMPRDNKYAQTTWRQTPAHIGGFVSDGGVHVAAGLQVLAGPIESVQATSAVLQPYLGGPDLMVINLRFQSGVLGQVTLGYGVLDYDHSPSRPKLYGDKGTLAVTRDQVEVWLHDGARRVEPVEGPRNYVAEFIAFHEAVAQGDKSADSARAAFEDLRFIDAALRSAETGEAVRL
jgi:predicted dehydrogenase